MCPGRQEDGASESGTDPDSPDPAFLKRHQKPSVFPHILSRHSTACWSQKAFLSLPPTSGFRLPPLFHCGTPPPYRCGYILSLWRGRPRPPLSPRPAPARFQTLRKGFPPYYAAHRFQLTLNFPLFPPFCHVSVTIHNVI